MNFFPAQKDVLTGGLGTPFQSLSQNLEKVNPTFLNGYVHAYLFYALGGVFIEHLAQSSQRWLCIHAFLTLMIIGMVDTMP